MTNTTRLPEPVAEQWDWQLYGACRDMDSSLFFHPDAERGHARDRRTELAKAVCYRCPVLMECRRYALDAREPFGVWGGLDESERREVLARERVRVPA